MAFGAKITSYRRRCDVIASHRQYYCVICRQGVIIAIQMYVEIHVYLHVMHFILFFHMFTTVSHVSSGVNSHCDLTYIRSLKLV